MNTQPATLIPADHGTHASSPDVDTLGISAYQPRPGQAYLNPEKIVNWAGGPWGTAYWAIGQALQTCGLWTATAPSPWQKSALLQAQGTPLIGNNQAPIGQAPTSGVYTGVHEEGCN